MALRLLYIDDNPNDLELISEVLRNCGHTVESTTDPNRGIMLFMQTDFDAVLLDYQFPTTDGGILSYEMRRWKPNLPIIFVSSVADRAKHDRGVGVLVEKSLSIEQLEQSLSNALAAIVRKKFAA